MVLVRETTISVTDRDVFYTILVERVVHRELDAGRFAGFQPYFVHLYVADHWQFEIVKNGRLKHFTVSSIVVSLSTCSFSSDTRIFRASIVSKSVRSEIILARWSIRRCSSLRESLIKTTRKYRLFKVVETLSPPSSLICPTYRNLNVSI